MQTTIEAAPPEEAPRSPSRLGRWLLAGLLFTMYLPMQVLLAVPAVVVAISTGGITSMDDLLESETVLWLTLGAAALAAALTIVAAAVWPRLWQVFTSRRHTPGEWLAWRAPRKLPLWAVPLLTFPVLIVVGLLVALLFGPTEIDIQLQLFSTPALGVASAVIVSTVVPVAEELIFRGALYNAMLPHGGAADGWRRHAVPFVVSTVLFAAVHLLAGFETAAAIVQVIILSAYLTSLRTFTGSVKASVVGHLVWNLIAAVGLLVSTLIDLPGITS